MSEGLPPADATQLILLCRAGRLYEIEEWIRAGRSLKVPEDFRETPLGVAIKTGFHSLIELLLRNESSTTIKNDVLRRAVEMRRADLVELAVRHGAETGSVPFADVLLSWDRRIFSFFIERGADLVTDVPFAWAFCEKIRTALGCYLDCKRSRPDLAAQLQEQADIALRHFSREGSLKWVSLLMWAGASPRSHGPTIEYLNDPDMNTTAFHEACVAGHLEILKRLQPDPNQDDVADLLRDAAMFGSRDIIAYLLGLGTNPNDRPNGGSGALHACLLHLGWEDRDRLFFGRHYQTPAYKVSNTREAIRLLVEHGAVWKPDKSINDVRRVLYRIDPEVTVELVGLFAKHHACDEVTLHNLLRTPQMKQRLATFEQRFARLGLTPDGLKRPPSEKRGSLPSEHVLRQFNRERLFEQVWSEPTRTVAASYGISDAWLAKVCRELNVPKPPRGYWAKKAAGQRVPRRPKLPRAPDEK